MEKEKLELGYGCRRMVAPYPGTYVVMVYFCLGVFLGARVGGMGCGCDGCRGSADVESGARVDVSLDLL